MSAYAVQAFYSDDQLSCFRHAVSGVLDRNKVLYKNLFFDVVVQLHTILTD